MYADEVIDDHSFTELNSIEDEEKALYLATHKQLDEIRLIANILYLYTAKQNENGEYMYVLDGLNSDNADFRHIGDPLEAELIEPMKKCLEGEVAIGNRLMVTEWGVVFIAYFPFLAATAVCWGQSAWSSTAMPCSRPSTS